MEHRGAQRRLCKHSGVIYRGRAKMRSFCGGAGGVSSKRAEERLHKIMSDLMFLAGRRMTAGPHKCTCVSTVSAFRSL